jgi:hypothetical protein
VKISGAVPVTEAVTPQTLPFEVGVLGVSDFEVNMIRKYTKVLQTLYESVEFCEFFEFSIILLLS